ncbi:hypothetical protein M0R04_08400 [Candidatus Dojkabacteria bacterium]|jgi:hypothetical protein|nr:hypothetical protein [Candidatus Dojkabacteria bacterium]
MILPTQDKELKTLIYPILEQTFRLDDKFSYNVHSHKDIGNGIDRILLILEELGYHLGLPPSIEEALNSGDGVYRP